MTEALITDGCLHKWDRINKEQREDLRALHVHFDFYSKKTGAHSNRETGFTCVYLLTVVDQKNLISRHGREGEGYKNTVFTSLIRS